MNKVDLKKLASYEEDFALWSAEQAALIRAGKFDRVDLENAAEELESLGRSEEHQIDSRMEVLLQDLLKWHFQPEKRTNSWNASILEQRIRIGRIVKRSASLASYPAASLDGSFVVGKTNAMDDTKLPESAFPERCPYTVEQVLDITFFPDPA
ncbi:MAG TPA: DUF29 domain-containing protein [Devosia sp.]